MPYVPVDEGQPIPVTPMSPPAPALAPAPAAAPAPHVAVEREEAEWMARAGRGDADAFVDLYRRYERRVYGLGLRMLRDAGLAEELVQETFVRLWRGAAGYEPELGSVRTWVVTIARRAAISLWRRPSSRPVEPPPLAEVGEEDRADQIVLAVSVRDALEALTPEHREVLELCIDRDMSQAQAAAHLGIPVGTVKSRTHLALKSLEAELSRRGILA